MGEFFETYDGAGRPTGLVERATVHRQGWWHRAVHVWVFRSDGRVYVQRRAADKDTSPGCWDVSVGEHLQPGEDYATAARRGLMEELGVDDVVLEPVGRARWVRQEHRDLGVDDREIQRVYRACHDGPVTPEPEEIAELRLWTLDALRAAVAAAPDDFTPGLRRDLEALRVPGE